MTGACMEGRTRMSHKNSWFYVHLCVRHGIELLDLLWLGFPGFTLSCYYLYLQKFFQSSRDRQSCWKKLIFSSSWESDFLHCSCHFYVTLCLIHFVLCLRKALDVISGELDKVVVKVWRCPCCLEKQEREHKNFETNYSKTVKNLNFPRKKQCSSKRRPALSFPHINVLSIASFFCVFSCEDSISVWTLFAPDRTFWFPCIF